MIADISYSQNFYTGTPPEATRGTEGEGGGVVAREREVSWGRDMLESSQKMIILVSLGRTYFLCPGRGRRLLSSQRGACTLAGDFESSFHLCKYERFKIKFDFERKVDVKANSSLLGW